MEYCKIIYCKIFARLNIREDIILRFYVDHCDHLRY
jgi:hypothetical protein